MKKYTEDNEIVVTIDEEGNEKQKMVYRGDYFEISLDKEGLVNFRRYSVLLLITIGILHVGGGFVNNQGMYQFYVVFPYVFSFLPLFYLAAGILRLPKEKRQYRRVEIGLSFDRMKTSSYILMALLGIGVVGEIVFLVFVSVGDHGGLEYLFLALEILVSVAVYFLIRLRKQILVENHTEQERQ